MGCVLLQFTISCLILVISSSSQLRLFTVQGRRIAELADSSKMGQTVNEEKAILRAQIGSRPPRCHRRCACGHCEAIQVPTNPQVATANANSAATAYARGDSNSNYKPMSWKCKCGNLIFNP